MKAARGSSAKSAVTTVTQWSWFPHEVMTSNQASQKRRVPAMIAVTSINCRRFQVSQAKVVRHHAQDDVEADPQQ